MVAVGGGPMNDTLYVPEHFATLRPEPTPDDDVRLLRARCSTAEPASPTPATADLPVVPAAEIAAPRPGRPAGGAGLPRRAARRRARPAGPTPATTRCSSSRSPTPVPSPIPHDDARGVQVRVGARLLDPGTGATGRRLGADAAAVRHPAGRDAASSRRSSASRPRPACYTVEVDLLNERVALVRLRRSCRAGRRDPLGPLRPLTRRADRDRRSTAARRRPRGAMPVSTATNVDEAQALLAGAPSPVVVIPVYDSYDDVVRASRPSPPTRRRRSPSSSSTTAAPTGASSTCSTTAATDRATHVVVLQHATNQGFVRSCNDAFAATAGRDVVLAQQRRRRRARVARAAHGGGAAATTPWPRRRTLTNHGTILSVPYRNRPGAHAARRADARRRPPGGSPPAACACGRRSPPPSATASTSGATPSTSSAAFDETFGPGYGEEVDFSQRAVAHGFRHVVRRRRVHLPPGRRQLRRRRRGRRSARPATRRSCAERYPWYAGWVAATAATTRRRRWPTPSATARRALRRPHRRRRRPVPRARPHGHPADRRGDDPRRSPAATEIDRLVAFVPPHVPPLRRRARAPSSPTSSSSASTRSRRPPSASSTSCTGPTR